MGHLDESLYKRDHSHRSKAPRLLGYFGHTNSLMREISGSLSVYRHSKGDSNPLVQGPSLTDMARHRRISSSCLLTALSLIELNSFLTRFQCDDMCREI